MVRAVGEVNEVRGRRHPDHAPGQGLEARIRRLAPPRVGPFREGAFRSRLHEDRIATWLGIALGTVFLVCFLTGLVSHLIQHPVPWFRWPSRPIWLYRVTQGVHVAAGIAAVPLLLAKLWAVSPQLWTWPPFRSVGHLLERVSLLPLVGGSLFLLVSGIASINAFRPWSFSFPAAHYAAAWITIGALVAHVGAKLHTAARVLARSEADPAPVAPSATEPALSRRGFLGAAAAGAAAVTIATVGQTVRPLRVVSVLAPRDPGLGPQGVPVNHTARQARVIELATSPDYRLAVSGNVGSPLLLSLDDLRAMPQHEATLPIACVDGWSATGTWRGIRFGDLLALAGAGSRTADVVSLQQGAAFARSTIDEGHAADPATLLALELNGEPLALDHGFPLRLIAPSRPGVLQTKWVTRVEVA